MACSVQPNDQPWVQQASGLQGYSPSVKLAAKPLEKGELTQRPLNRICMDHMRKLDVNTGKQTNE